jgi:hypothetical protein
MAPFSYICARTVAVRYQHAQDNLPSGRSLCKIHALALHQPGHVLIVWLESPCIPHQAVTDGRN